MSDLRGSYKANPAPTRCARAGQAVSPSRDQPGYRRPVMSATPTSANSTAATFCVTFGFSKCPACLPTVTATAATDQSAAVAAQKTSTGCLACAAKPAVAICVRSPHSAMNPTMNDIVNALAKPSCPPSLPVSGSSSFLRHMTIAETKNSTPEPMCTARDGSRDSKLPAMTATRLWMASAAAAPASTGSARCRVASTSDAKAVLSGSSATKMTAKIERNRRAAAMARQYGAISAHAPKQTGPVDRGGAGRRSLDHARDAAHWSDAACARADCDGPPDHGHPEGARPPVHPLAAGDEAAGRPLPRARPARSGRRHSADREEPRADAQETEGRRRTGHLPRRRRQPQVVRLRRRLREGRQRVRGARQRARQPVESGPIGRDGARRLRRLHAPPRWPHGELPAGRRAAGRRRQSHALPLEKRFR